MSNPGAIDSGRQAMGTVTAEEQVIPQGRAQMGLTIRNAAQLPAELWPDERISAVRAYVGKEATTIGELAAFLATCQRYGLDPMVGQLFLIKSDSGPKVTTGRDTWLSLARREPGYAGVLFGTVHDQDEFGHSRGEDGRIQIHHVVAGVRRGALIGAYCLVRDRLLGDNIEVRELKDFNHLMNKNNWKNYKADMLQNRVIAAVLRKEYGFPGLLIAGEEDELVDPTERAMPPADAPTASVKGAGATLASIVHAKHLTREPAEEAQDVEIEPAGQAGEPPAATPVPAAEAATLVPGVVRAEVNQARAMERPKKLEQWRKLMGMGEKRTEFQNMALADINADWPEFNQEFGSEYGLSV